MEVSGNIRAEANVDGKAVTLRDESGRAALRYNKLMAFDATGRELASRMKVSAGEVWLEVDDREARYPVTIDPIFSQLKKLTASDGAVGDRFGDSVSVSCDTAVVGASSDDDNGNNSGSAYIFKRNQGGADQWVEVKKLTASDGAAGDQFGRSVAISGDSVVVGAEGDDDNGDNSGSAYIFERNQGGADNWGQFSKITASDGAVGDRFGGRGSAQGSGQGVAISCDTIIVGARRAGSAYIFTTTCSAQQQIQAIIQMVDDLVIQEVLTGEQTKGLKAKLYAAITLLDQGKPRPACNQLGAFINQVKAFVNARALTFAQGQRLIRAAVAVRETICQSRRGQTAGR